ncbi:hypothetical protein [Lysobacter sp. P5_B9]
MKRSTRRAMLGLALALASTSALAEVVFNPTTGTGFVGKGDVQDAFGWNDAGLQLHATGVTFTYGYTAVYQAVCTFTTGEGTRGEKIHNVPHSEEMDVSSTVNVSLRRNPQSKVTGFNLTGFGGDFSESGEVPVVGGPCPGNPGHGGVWTSVELLPGGEGGLYANYGALKVLLTP